MLEPAIGRRELFLQAWTPRPNSGSVVKDLLFLLLIVFVQTTVAPAVLGRFGHLDFMTPWLVITFIRQRVAQALLLAFVGAFLLETRLAVPAGLYICSYTILCTILAQIRPALSWRYKTPWLVCYAASSLWVMVFEGFVIQFMQNASPLGSWSYIAQSVLRILTATGFGMYLAREWMTIDAEEPVPQ